MRGGDIDDEKESSEDVNAHFLGEMLLKPGREKKRSVWMLTRNGSSPS
jgi:hypothetical protein